MSARPPSIKRAVSSNRSFLMMSGVTTLIIFATVGVNAHSLIANLPPTALVLFAAGLGGLILLGRRRKRRAS